MDRYIGVAANVMVDDLDEKLRTTGMVEVVILAQQTTYETVDGKVVKAGVIGDMRFVAVPEALRELARYLEDRADYAEKYAGTVNRLIAKEAKQKKCGKAKQAT